MLSAIRQRIKVTRSQFNGFTVHGRRAYILEEMLPDREYDLTEAICEGVKEIGRVKKKKGFRNMQKLGEFLVHRGFV